MHPHRVEFFFSALYVGPEIDPAGAEFGCERARTRTERGKVQRNRIGDVDQAEIGIEEADCAGFAFEIPTNRFTAQQRLNPFDVHLEPPQRNCTKTHCAASGEPGAHAEVDAPRRDLVQRRERICRDRFDSIRRDQHTGAQANALRRHRGLRHADEHVGVQQLRVVEPCVGETQFFGAFDRFP